MTTRGDRAGIDDRWHKRVRQPDGSMATVKSAMYGRVKARWRVRWVVDGREHTKVFERKVDAQAHRDHVRADVVKGTYVSPHKSSVLFRGVAEEWIAGKGARRPKTVAGYRSILDTLILPRFGDTKLLDITHGDVQKWISGLSVSGGIKREGKGLSPSRVIQTHQCLSAILKYAIRTERLSRNAADGIELPRKRESERQYLSHEQVLALASRMGRFETLTLILSYCGLRWGEAIALRGKDIKDGTITVSTAVTNITGRGLVEDTTKTGKTRWVPVPAFIWERLKNELPDDPNALVFPGNREGEWLTTGQFRHVFDPAAVAVGVPGLVPHELRHTCASLSIASGANILAVQRLLGHQTASMTMDRYGHLYSDDLEKVAQGLDTASRAARKRVAV